MSVGELELGPRGMFTLPAAFGPEARAGAGPEIWLADLDGFRIDVPWAVFREVGFPGRGSVGFPLDDGTPGVAL